MPKKVSADDLVKIDIDINDISLKEINEKTAKFKLDIYNSSEDSQNRTYIIEKDLENNNSIFTTISYTSKNYIFTDDKLIISIESDKIFSF